MITISMLMNFRRFLNDVWIRHFFACSTIKHPTDPDYYQSWVVMWAFDHMFRSCQTGLICPTCDFPIHEFELRSPHMNDRKEFIHAGCCTQCHVGCCCASCCCDHELWGKLLQGSEDLSYAQGS